MGLVCPHLVQFMFYILCILFIRFIFKFSPQSLPKLLSNIFLGQLTNQAKHRKLTWIALRSTMQTKLHPGSEIMCIVQPQACIQQSNSYVLFFTCCSFSIGMLINASELPLERADHWTVIRPDSGDGHSVSFHMHIFVMLFGTCGWGLRFVIDMKNPIGWQNIRKPLWEPFGRKLEYKIFSVGFLPPQTIQIIHLTSVKDRCIHDASCIIHAWCCMQRNVLQFWALCAWRRRGFSIHFIERSWGICIFHLLNGLGNHYWWKSPVQYSIRGENLC